MKFKIHVAGKLSIARRLETILENNITLFSKVINASAAVTLLEQRPEKLIF